MDPDNVGVGDDKKPDPSTTSATGAAGSGGANDDSSSVVKANKGMILRKSIEYIRYLQQLVTAQGARNRELERELRGYRERERTQGSSIGMSDEKEGGDTHMMVEHEHDGMNHHQNSSFGQGQADFGGGFGSGVYATAGDRE
ncbi:hypothetical protein C8R42DRAFT_242158 [Lentinula raphanica]|nr:hypothetical protein C8R42DRAFT_242158 [Lentinula raphanica]